MENKTDFLVKRTLIKSKLTSSYTIHDNITIINDADFHAQAKDNWDVQGTHTGNVTHPYIIEGLNITDPLNHQIEIQNTTVFFQIRKCFLKGEENVDSLQQGICLINVTNANISSNIISYNLDGISLSNSVENVISNNIIANNSHNGVIMTADSDFNAFINNTVTLKRLIVVPLYLLFTIPFFFVEGLWIIGLLRTQSKNGWPRTRIEWTGKAVFIKCFPYASIILLQLIESYLLGSAYISGMIGFFLLFLWMFTPFFIISTVILMWSYQTTERIYIGVFLNSLIFSWTMASILTLAM